MQTDHRRALEIQLAAQTGDLARLRALLPRCGDQAEDGCPELPGHITPLMAAAAGGHEACVELLLECGADPSRRDTQGHSAAYHARVSGHLHLAERLDAVVDQEKTMW
jgi:ankyrin repeat protein